MSYLPETGDWADGIYQFETSDPIQGGPDGIDNVPTKQLANRTSWLRRVLQFGRTTYTPDTGTKNNIVANLSPTITELVDGMEACFRVAVTNDNACTFTPTSAAGSTIPKLPLLGADHADLGAGDLPAGAGVRARLNTQLNKANGGAWVIQSISGGTARIVTPPVGDKSSRAANMAAVFAATDGRQIVDVGVDDTTITLTAAQYGVAMLTLSGTLKASKDLVFPAQSGQWIIENSADGNFNITAKVAGGTGVVLPAGSPVIVCSDGAAMKFASAGGQAGFRPVPITGITGNTINIVGGYTPGAVMLERNGALQQPGTAASPDFLATDGLTIKLTNAATADEQFTAYLFSTFSVADAVKKSGDAMGGPLALYAGSTTPNLAQNDNSQSVPNSAWIHPLAAHGQCRLSYASATALILKPYNGQCLNIDGTVQQIPRAGVTLPNTGLAASTLYYIYAAWSGNAIALSASTTGHSTAANGVETMTGNAALTLVGMCYTNASAQFVQTSTIQTVRSYFNRPACLLATATFVNSTTNQSATALGGGFAWLSWADEQPFIQAVGYAANGTAGCGWGAALSIDGTTGSSTTATATSVGANATAALLSSNVPPAAEGYHSGQLYGYANSGGNASFTWAVQGRIGGA
ncbi:hypothetical protein [Paraburkholderia sp. J76]|uniref:hypothetical protein n=1 Tax=Paraburkholderia sp. J76 TaxID=2805439 RepID=UPI002ABE42CA|nr:hypothetical protein [Paraburkholderia sp. J76]